MNEDPIDTVYNIGDYESITNLCYEYFDLSNGMYVDQPILIQYMLWQYQHGLLKDFKEDIRKAIHGIRKIS